MTTAAVEVTGRGTGFGRRRVLLVDDHPLTRDALRRLLSAEPGLSVCGEAGTLEEARVAAARLLPDLILLDLQLPDGHGLLLLEEVRGWDDPPKVVVVSGCNEGSPEVLKAFQLGAIGFIGKPTPGNGVLAAVRQAAAGQGALPDAVLMRLIGRNR